MKNLWENSQRSAKIEILLQRWAELIDNVDNFNMPIQGKFQCLLFAYSENYILDFDKAIGFSLMVVESWRMKR